MTVTVPPLPGGGGGGEWDGTFPPLLFVSFYVGYLGGKIALGYFPLALCKLLRVLVSSSSAAFSSTGCAVC